MSRRSRENLPQQHLYIYIHGYRPVFCQISMGIGQYFVCESVPYLCLKRTSRCECSDATAEQHRSINCLRMLSF